MRFRGQFCYVDVILPGHRKPAPIVQLRYQGSAELGGSDRGAPGCESRARPGKGWR
jgi:hypothetical protein